MPDESGASRPHWTRKMGTRLAGDRTSFRTGLRRLVGHRVDPDDQSWFYHPEIQARIAAAEADLREGRYFTAHSVEEALAYLHSLGKPER